MEYAIIGSGPAGSFAAKEIRQLDSKSQITIITKDAYPFYSRPRIPELISGKSTVEQLLVFPRKWYIENRINLILKAIVAQIKPSEHCLVLDDNKKITYDRLLIATGSLPRQIPVKGSTGNRVLALNSAEDAISLNKLSSNSKRALVIGAGFVGIEAAASMASLGVRVTVIEVCDRILPRQLDKEMSDIIRPRLESLGITFILSSNVEEIKDEADVKTIILKNGQTLHGDFVLIAAGINSSISLASDSGIRCNRSVIIDDFMQTSIEHIYSAGDVAEHKGTCYGIWPVSKEQGEIAGKNMAGDKAAYNGSVPMTFLKIAGIELASVGDISCMGGSDVEQHLKADPKTGIYKKLFVRNGILQGGIFVGDTKSAQRLKQAVGRDFSMVKDVWEMA